MKTKTIYQFIHDLPTTKALNNKKSGAIGRPARGSEIGVMVAHVLDDNSYGLQVSLVHPGKEMRGGWKDNADKFDRHIALHLALGKLMEGLALPRVCTAQPNTHRAKHIQTQFNAFRIQAAKVFKDKNCTLNGSQLQIGDQP